MSQYQHYPRITLKTSVFCHFQVRLSLAILLMTRKDTAAEETCVRGKFFLCQDWYGGLMCNA